MLQVRVRFLILSKPEHMSEAALLIPRACYKCCCNPDVSNGLQATITFDKPADNLAGS